MVINGVLGEDEPLGDLGVPESLRDEREHLELTCGEVGRILPRRRPRPSRQPACAALPQPAGDDGRRGAGPELLQLVERTPHRLFIV